MISQEKLNIIFEGIQQYWLETEVEDKNSIFFKKKKTEKEFKKLHRRSGGVTLKIIKAIKFSILKKGKCYYSQRDFAKYFKVNQSTIKQSIKLIEKVLQTKFIPFPKEVINNGLSKHCSYRQILIPPSLFKKLNLSVVCKNNPSVVTGNPSVVIKEPECSKKCFLNKIKHIKIDTYIPIYYTLYSKFYSLLLPSEVIEEQNITKEKPSFSLYGTSFLKEKSMKLKKFVLKPKPSFVATYESYGLHPKQFMNHVELHKHLSKWFDILIENNVVPKIENTKMFLSSWNNFGNTRFIKHRINPKSKTFKLICLALTYRMWSEKINIDDIEKAIEKFDLLASKQGKLLHCKKLDCLSTFLWNSKEYGQKDYFKLSILDEDIVLTEYYNKIVPPKRAFERVRKMFGVIFYNDKPNFGKEVFKKNYKRFVDFTNEMVENHRTKETGRFGEYDDILEGFTDYIKTYFEYVFSIIKNSNSTYRWNPAFILNQHGEFVLWLSHQKGWEDFMKDKKIEEKPTKFKLSS